VRETRGGEDRLSLVCRPFRGETVGPFGERLLVRPFRGETVGGGVVRFVGPFGERLSALSGRDYGSGPFGGSRPGETRCGLGDFWGSEVARSKRK
jgi:hypothetical protein